MAIKRMRTTVASNDGLDVGDIVEDAGAAAREVRYSSGDGLSLFANDYGDPLSPWLPVVCLAGLTRTSRDFNALAVHLSTHRHRPRRVVAFDYRGRGRSQWDKNSDNYNPLIEMGDVLDGMARLGIPPHVIERVLNHVSGSQSGVAGIYNRYGYLPEKRQALDAWSRYLENLVLPGPQNVVSLATVRG